ncbi:MAG: hypothetical protein WCC26_01135 [Terracidiphilus sp.]
MPIALLVAALQSSSPQASDSNPIGVGYFLAAIVAAVMAPWW